MVGNPSRNHHGTGLPGDPGSTLPPTHHRITDRERPCLRRLLATNESQDNPSFEASDSYSSSAGQPRDDDRRAFCPPSGRNSSARIPVGRSRRNWWHSRGSRCGARPGSGPQDTGSRKKQTKPWCRSLSRVLKLEYSASQPLRIRRRLPPSSHRLSGVQSHRVYLWSLPVVAAEDG